MRCAKCNKLLPTGSYVAFDEDNNSLCPECFEKRLGSELVKCDCCGKVTYNPTEFNKYVFCPDCWEFASTSSEKLMEEITRRTRAVVDPAIGTETKVELTNKNVTDLIKGVNAIAKELHELNKNLRRR